MMLAYSINVLLNGILSQNPRDTDIGTSEMSVFGSSVHPTWIEGNADEIILE